MKEYLNSILGILPVYFYNPGS